MKEGEFFWLELGSEIEKELENIDKLKKELDSAVEDNIRINNRRLLGSILHDFYNCCERIFKNITRNINGGFAREEKWHKSLLYSMTIEIKDVRPRIITEELAAELDDYLTFRHVFRNIYGFELKGERLDRLVAKFGWVCDDLKKQIYEFIKRMESE